MLNGHRGNVGVGSSRATAGAIAVAHQASPYGGGTAVERQDAPVELRSKVLLDPFLESFAAPLFPHLPRASNELSHGLRGKEEIGRIPSLDPIQHRSPGTWPYGLADNVCIQKKGHQPKSADRPVDLSRSIGSSASVSGEARRKATNSAPVRTLGVPNTGCSDRRTCSASCPPERNAPAIALTSDASREGTVTSTRWAPLAETRLR